MARLTRFSVANYFLILSFCPLSCSLFTKWAEIVTLDDERVTTELRQIEDTFISCYGVKFAQYEVQRGIYYRVALGECNMRQCQEICY